MNQHLFSIWISSSEHNHRTIVSLLRSNETFRIYPFHAFALFLHRGFPRVPRHSWHGKWCSDIAPLAAIKNRHVRQQKQKLSLLHNVGYNTDGTVKTRYNFVAKLASSWTINMLISGYTIIVYKEWIYVRENNKKYSYYIVFIIIASIVCFYSTTRCRFIPMLRFVIDRCFLVNKTKDVYREKLVWNHFRRISS